MNQRVGLFVLLAAGLLCLSLAPASRAEDLVEDGPDGEDADVEDEMDLGLAGDENEDLEEDVQDEASSAPKTPPSPQVRPCEGGAPAML